MTNLKKNMIPQNYEDFVLKKMNLNQMDILINGKLMMSLEHLEWSSDIIQADTLRQEKLISTTHKIKPIKGFMILEQSEKLLLAESLGAKNGMLSGKICDLVAHDQDGRNFTLRQLRFTKDSFKLSSSDLEDKTQVHFMLLGPIEWNLTL